MQKAVLITARGQMPVTVAETAGGILVIYQGQGQRALFGLKPAETEDAQPVTRPDAPPRARLNPRASAWDWLTPEAVIEYFRNSPVLSYLADDVAAQLRDEAAVAAGQRAADQLADDLAAVEPYLDNIVQDGRFVYGYQSRIAEALRIPNEGGYRRRIKNVAAALAKGLNSTSTNIPTDRQFEKKRRTA